MMIIRPITSADLPALVGLAASTGVGLTTLPPNKEELAKRVEAAVASFAGTAAKEDEIFLFVLEDTTTKQVTGTSGLATAVGLRQPWYSYRVGLVVHASQELGLFTQTPTLFLTNDHTGHTELCSLFLDAAYRRDRNGQLLSKSRLLFLAQHRQRFSKKIIAELRGVSDADGKSPFWESLGRHFFSMEFSRADYLTGIGRKSFVAELMPKHPLYSSFLTPEAQDVIGKTHPETLPALHMLEREGFRYEGYVDIFDAGPTVECDVDDVSAVEQSRILTVRISDVAPAAGSISFLVSNTGIANYRATIVPGCAAAGDFTVNAETAAALGVDSGDPVRAVPLSVSDRHERQT
jgi:arginine N-succinyltransferase